MIDVIRLVLGLLIIMAVAWVVVFSLAFMVRWQIWRHQLRMREQHLRKGSDRG